MGSFLERQDGEAAGVEWGLVEKPIYLEELKPWKHSEIFFFETSDTKRIDFIAQACPVTGNLILI